MQYGKDALPRNEVQLDTLLRKLVHSTKLLQVVKALDLLVLAWIIFNLNVSVVPSATGESWLDNRSALDLAEAMRWSHDLGDEREEVIDVSWASPLSTVTRLLCKRIRKTIQMPRQTTVGAGDDHAIRSGCLAIALMAENDLAGLVPLLEVIRSFFPGSFAGPFEIISMVASDQVTKLTWAWAEQPPHTRPRHQS